jgi:hypothetical protein
MASPAEQAQRARISDDMRAIRATIKALETNLPAALGWQWVAPSRPRADDSPGGHSEGTYNDPTSRVALDPDRLELRAALAEIAEELAYARQGLGGALYRLKHSLEPYGGSDTP